MSEDGKVLNEFYLETGTTKGVPDLTPWKPEPLDPQQVIGRTILQWCDYCGTYGMGGPGFVGFRLRKAKPHWLLVTIWGADQWMYAHGRSLGGGPKYRTRPWTQSISGMENWDELTEKVVGRKITDLIVRPKSMRMQLDTGFTIEIQPSAITRSRYEGSRQLRAFKPEDDLRKGVFLAPTCSIWI